MVSYSRGHGMGSSDSTSYSTQRQRVLSPGEIANLPPGRALYMVGVRWCLVQLTPYYAIYPWPAVLTARPEANHNQTQRGTPRLGRGPVGDGVGAAAV